MPFNGFVFPSVRDKNVSVQTVTLLLSLEILYLENIWLSCQEHWSINRCAEWKESKSFFKNKYFQAYKWFCLSSRRAMNMNSAEFQRNHLSLLKLVLCQHKNLPPSSLPAAQTAALWGSLSGSGALAQEGQAWNPELDPAAGLGEGWAAPDWTRQCLARSCRGLAHGKPTGLPSPALPSHLHRIPRGCHPAPVPGLRARWKSAEFILPGGRRAGEEPSSKCTSHSCKTTTDCPTPCINSSLLANLIKRWKGKGKKATKGSKHQFPLRIPTWHPSLAPGLSSNGPGPNEQQEERT